MSDEAARFAIEHAHYREDLPLWRAAAARLGSPVLDLGAAAGRVALELARAGHEVWALDRSPAMLAEIGRRLRAEPELAGRVRLVEGDLRALDLGRRFPLALLAMNTLQALTAPGDQLACLRGAAAHLEHGGELFFDVALPDVAEIEGSLGHEREGGLHRDPDSGVTLAHSAWYDDWDPLTQTLRFTLRIRERAPGWREREWLRGHTVHLFTPSELVHLLARAGLETLAVMGDFGGRPVEASGERQIYRCRAAA